MTNFLAKQKIATLVLLSALFSLRAGAVEPGLPSPDPSIRNPDWLAERFICLRECALTGNHWSSQALTVEYSAAMKPAPVAKVSRASHMSGELGRIQTQSGICADRRPAQGGLPRQPPDLRYPGGRKLLYSCGSGPHHGSHAGQPLGSGELHGGRFYDEDLCRGDAKNPRTNRAGFPQWGEPWIFGDPEAAKLYWTRTDGTVWWPCRTGRAFSSG